MCHRSQAGEVSMKTVCNHLLLMVLYYNRVMFSTNILDMGGIDSVNPCGKLCAPILISVFIKRIHFVEVESIVAFGAGLVAHGTTQRLSRISPTTLFPFTNDSFRLIARQWFGNGDLYHRQFDELRLSESLHVTTKGSVDEVHVYQNAMKLHSVDCSLAVVSDNLVPNDELLERAGDDFIGRHGLKGRVRQVGNVVSRNFPASICFWHGWIAAVITCWLSK
jgi:hypothetical protein